MKVAEKATDRRAEAHIYVEGKVQALEEYGEYIDSRDNAICCYVSVDEGHKIKIGGKFSGTTLTVAYDAVVDGVYRKASSYAAKTVHNQKNKKMDAETFLYKTDKGIIDTDMLVTSLSGVTITQGEGPETIGTMELRVYVTRQLSVSHAIVNVEKYYNPKGNIEDDTNLLASYKRISPTFQMTFEKNSAPLDRIKAAREQRRMEAMRPGTEPWAIFRFHYRSKEAIMEQNMKMTFDPLSRTKTEPHTLVLDAVPPLFAGTKPPRDDGDSSTRASSPLPPEIPSTPVKDTQKERIPKPITSTKKPQPKPTTTKTPNTEKESTISPGSSPSPPTHEDVSEDLRARVFSKSSPTPVAKEMSAPGTDKAVTNGDGDSVISSSTMSDEGNKVAATSKDDAPAYKPTLPSKDTSVEPGTGDKPVGKPVDKPVVKEQSTAKDTITVTQPKGKPTGLTEYDAAKTSGLPDTNTKVTNGTAAKTTTQAKENSHKGPQPSVTYVKKPAVKPTPITTTTTIVQKAPPAPVTPNKRPVEVTDHTSPDLKRPKVATAPLTPSASSIVLQGTPGSPSPRPLSIERQVAEQRKKLEALRKKRMEIAKKQSAIDEQMSPYKQRMAEELERLNAEMMEEETAYTEEEEHFNASVEILEEFKNVDSGA